MGQQRQRLQRRPLSLAWWTSDVRRALRVNGDTGWRLEEQDRLGYTFCARGLAGMSTMSRPCQVLVARVTTQDGSAWEEQVPQIRLCRMPGVFSVKGEVERDFGKGSATVGGQRPVLPTSGTDRGWPMAVSATACNENRRD